MKSHQLLSRCNPFIRLKNHHESKSGGHQQIRLCGQRQTRRASACWLVTCRRHRPPWPHASTAGVGGWEVGRLGSSASNPTNTGTTQITTRRFFQPNWLEVGLSQVVSMNHWKIAVGSTQEFPFIYFSSIIPSGVRTAMTLGMRKNHARSKGCSGRFPPKNQLWD